MIKHIDNQLSLIALVLVRYPIESFYGLFVLFIHLGSFIRGAFIIVHSFIHSFIWVRLYSIEFCHNPIKRGRARSNLTEFPESVPTTPQTNPTVLHHYHN